MQTFYEDWIMSQIRLIIAAIARTIFRKDNVAYVIADPANKTETDELYLHLGVLLDAGKINDAEDLLFESLSPGNQGVLLVAVDFYQRLNMLSDEALLRSHFSRQEIYDGLLEVQRFYGLRL